MITLPEDFYLEETRSGYLVTKKMKRIWAVQLDLLNTFADVCEENNLQYFLNGGTLLGAVRHQGFIPWDDDVDVMMPREDYNRLCDISGAVFRHPYFFQTSLTERGLFRTHAQLRNSSTTGYILTDENKKINKGIFLDIFVLDGIPENKWIRRIHKERIGLWKKMLAYAYDRDSSTGKKRVFRNFYQQVLRVLPFEKQFRYFDRKVLAKYSRKNTKVIGDLTLQWNEKVHWDAGSFSGYEYMQFEGRKFRVPAGYHEILEKQYGNYKKLPEKEDRNKNEHGALCIDPDIPYTEYQKPVLPLEQI